MTKQTALIEDEKPAKTLGNREHRKVIAYEKVADKSGMPALEITCKQGEVASKVLLYSRPCIEPFMDWERFKDNIKEPPQHTYLCDIDIVATFAPGPFGGTRIMKIYEAKDNMKKQEEPQVEVMPAVEENSIEAFLDPTPPAAPVEAMKPLNDWAVTDNLAKWQSAASAVAFEMGIPVKEARPWWCEILEVPDETQIPCNGAEALKLLKKRSGYDKHVMKPVIETMPPIDMPEPPQTRVNYDTGELPAPQPSAMVPYQAPAVSLLPEQARWEIMREQAGILIKSGFLPSTVRTAEQAIAIMMMGEALNVKPIIALQSINVIQGKPTVSPQLMLALIRKSGQLADMTVSDDGTTCTVTMTRKGETAHTETFSMTDAGSMGLAGKDNWRKQPAVMRKWRAISAACRVVFPDIILGFYTPEEMNPDIVVED